VTSRVCKLWQQRRPEVEKEIVRLELERAEVIDLKAARDQLAVLGTLSNADVVEVLQEYRKQQLEDETLPEDIERPILRGNNREKAEIINAWMEEHPDFCNSFRKLNLSYVPPVVRVMNPRLAITPRLQRLPIEVGLLINLEELNLSRHGLSALPKEISRLTRLKILNLSHNQFKEIPPEATSLERLQVLDLSHNQVASQHVKSDDPELERHFPRFNMRCEHDLSLNLQYNPPIREQIDRLYRREPRLDEPRPSSGSCVIL
jgi:hypothetical protein